MSVKQEPPLDLFPRVTTILDHLILSLENSNFANASVSIQTTNTNTQLNELNNRSQIGGVYYQSKISPTNSGGSAAVKKSRSKNTGSATTSSSAWNWLGGGRLRKRTSKCM